MRNQGPTTIGRPGTGQYWSGNCEPVRGCSPVSAGCRFCYAARRASRGWKRGFHGFVEKVRVRAGSDDLRSNEVWQWTGRVEFRPDQLAALRRMPPDAVVFVGMMSDLFHESLLADQIVEIIRAAAEAPCRAFMLTKRASRLRRVMRDLALTEDRRLWFGVTVENQKAAWRIDHLQAVHDCGHRTFLSLEPLLERLDLDRILPWRPDGIIAGGETGAHARPAELSWFRQIRDCCAGRKIPFYVKSLGSDLRRRLKLKDVRTLDGAVHDALPWRLPR